MHVLSLKLTFHLPLSSSLKDKRKVRLSLINKTQQQFNVSIAEVATQDVQQTLTIGVSVVSGEFTRGKDRLDEIIRFMELQGENMGAELRVIEEFS